jgi:hypothetical protein
VLRLRGAETKSETPQMSGSLHGETIVVISGVAHLVGIDVFSC